jgi:hypothetical protein
MEGNSMLKRTVLSTICAATLLVTGVAYAQDSATLTLRSGEKVSGQLVDLGGVGYTMRVNGTDRTISQNDVAVVDFTGATMADADWAAFTGSPTVVLRNGQTINGSLSDISGTSPLKLTIRTASGDRDISSTEVARVIAARPDNVPATAGTTGTNRAVTTQSVPGAIAVDATQPWTQTNMRVRKGQTLTFSPTGTVQLSGDQNDIADANGSKSGRYAPNAPMRNVLAGALIGKIGPNGAPFAVGTMTITAPAAGVLYLGVNDDALQDNKGTFQVIIR